MSAFSPAPGRWVNPAAANPEVMAATQTHAQHQVAANEKMYARRWRVGEAFAEV
jgi:hypothetical protein